MYHVNVKESQHLFEKKNLVTITMVAEFKAEYKYLEADTLLKRRQL